MSSGSSGLVVPWLSTHAVQLTVPMGDDIQIVLRLRRALFRSSLAFLRYTLQTFPLLRRSSSSLCSLFRSYVAPLYRSSDFSVPMSFLFIVLLSGRHFSDGGVFRSIGIFFVFLLVFGI